jgi:hypothetical protein
MKKGLLHKFLLAPLLMLLLYIGTLFPLAGEGIRSLLHLLPELFNAAASLLITLLNSVTALANSFLSNISPRPAHGFSSLAGTALRLLTYVFSGLSPAF